jgi:hypothetical protein
MIPKLPEHLWSEIFCIDSTYRDHFTDQVLPFIHHYRVYTLRTNFFMIIDTFANETIVTDDFIKPTYISTHHNFSQSMIVKPKLDKTRSQIEKIINYNFVP